MFASGMTRPYMSRRCDLPLKHPLTVCTGCIAPVHGLLRARLEMVPYRVIRQDVDRGLAQEHEEERADGLRPGAFPAVDDREVIGRQFGLYVGCRVTGLRLASVILAVQLGPQRYSDHLLMYTSLL